MVATEQASSRTFLVKAGGKTVARVKEQAASWMVIMCDDRKKTIMSTSLGLVLTELKQRYGDDAELLPEHDLLKKK